MQCMFRLLSVSVSVFFIFYLYPQKYLNLYLYLCFFWQQTGKIVWKKNVWKRVQFWFWWSKHISDVKDWWWLSDILMRMEIVKSFFQGPCGFLSGSWSRGQNSPEGWKKRKSFNFLCNWPPGNIGSSLASAFKRKSGKWGTETGLGRERRILF